MQNGLNMALLFPPPSAIAPFPFFSQYHYYRGAQRQLVPKGFFTFEGFPKNRRLVGHWSIFLKALGSVHGKAFVVRMWDME